MIVVDSNILLKAYDVESSDHLFAKDWWTRSLQEIETIGLVEPVIFSFLRLSTTSKVYKRPLSLSVAGGHVKSWLAHGNVKLLRLSDATVLAAINLLEQVGRAGNLAQTPKSQPSPSSTTPQSKPLTMISNSSLA